MQVLTGTKWNGIILAFYLGLTIVIGYAVHWHARKPSTYLNSGRSLPLWIVAIAYLAVNCGALDIIGLSAMAAQYGVQAFHFYWIGAVPAIVFLSCWMMPVYRRSGIRSVPEFLELRYGPRLRLLNVCVLLVSMVLLAGISLYAVALILQFMAGFTFLFSVSITSAAVLTYVLLGGIRATIYNEVLQFAVIIAGLAPLLLLNVSGHIWRNEKTAAHLWLALPLASRSAPLDVAGVVLGLGFVLSFGYWCTDFVLMQRAFTVRTDQQARLVPLLAGIGKLGFGFLVVLPGLIAARSVPGLGTTVRFDLALPALMKQSYGSLMLGLGLTAITAGLVSGLAANTTAFAAAWTNDIYRTYLRPDSTDRHYLRVGRAAIVVAVVLSASISYASFWFKDLMEHVLLIFSIFGAPFWAIFLLGMGTRKTTERGAFYGFLCGTAVSALHLLAFSQGWIVYGSTMAANFYAAIYSFTVAVSVAWIISQAQQSEDAEPSDVLSFRRGIASVRNAGAAFWGLSLLLLAACLTLNWIWR